MGSVTSIKNREAWLEVMVARLRPEFERIKFPLPEKIRVSCGFPSERGLSKKRRVIGECWYPISSADESTEIFISPTLGHAYEAAETLAHELCHAAVGSGHGHKGKFIECAKPLGFTAPWKSSPASEELKQLLNKLLPGEYPHAELTNKAPDGTGKPKKTYLLKASCPDCSYVIRVTKQWADKGLPVCTNCTKRFELADIDALDAAA